MQSPGRVRPLWVRRFARGGTVFRGLQTSEARPREGHREVAITKKLKKVPPESPGEPLIMGVRSGDEMVTDQNKRIDIPSGTRSISTPMPVAVACFSCVLHFISAVSGPLISVSPSNFAPVLTQYLGRLVYLTVQTNILCTLYYAYIIFAIYYPKRVHHLRILRLFPLAFALDVFLTVGYYSLEHSNPSSMAKKNYWTENGYPYCIFSSHLEHIFALPIAIISSITINKTFLNAEEIKKISADQKTRNSKFFDAPSNRDVLVHTGSFILFYLCLTNINFYYTREWTYPILENLTKRGGAVLRILFQLAIIIVVLGLAFLGKKIVGIRHTYSK